MNSNLEPCFFCTKMITDGVSMMIGTNVVKVCLACDDQIVSMCDEE